MGPLDPESPQTGAPEKISGVQLTVSCSYLIQLLVASHDSGTTPESSGKQNGKFWLSDLSSSTFL
jgi:hypothetical protein